MPTECPVDETIDGAYHFLEKSIEKCIKNPAGRPGKFQETSESRQEFMSYRQRTTSFLDFAKHIAMKRFEFKDRYELFTPTDLFMCEIEWNEDIFIVGLELTCQEGVVHHVNQTDKGIQNNLLLHQAILPNVSLKNANFFMINEDTMELTLLESLVSTEDDDTYLYADKILECQTEISVKEAVKKARVVVDEIVETHQLDKLEIVPALERTIKEAINEGNDLNIKEIAEEVFYQTPEAKKSYVKEMKNQGIEKPIINPNKVKLPLKKKQKIKTDTGIEITIPLDYYNNKDYIELENTPDGRIAIRLKNIGVVENA